MKRSLGSLSLAALALLLTVSTARAQTGPTDPYAGMDGRLYTGLAGFTLPYRLGKPPAYDATKKYPLVIFLHGSGESGTDNRKQVAQHIGLNGPGSVFTTPANQAKFPTFFIAPQCPSATLGWIAGRQPLTAVLKLITELEAEFSIDPSRLYVTGLSMGGYGSWSAITANPTLFAAAIPMSGAGDPSMAAKIVRIPIWDFHGTVDDQVNVKGSRDMIAALRAAGGYPRYTEYPTGNHDIWTMAYSTPDLLPWMNAQRLGSLDPTGDGAAPIIPDGGAGDSAGGAAGTSGRDASVMGTAGTTGGIAGTAGTPGTAGNSAAGTSGGAAGSSGNAAGTSGGAAGTSMTGSAGTAAGTTGAAGTGGGRSSGGGCSVALAGADVSPSLLATCALALAAFGLRGSRRRRR